MMQQIRVLEGKQIKDIVTRFFYRGDELHFQVLLRLKGGETITLKEVTDYSTYKEMIDALARAREQRLRIHLNAGEPSLAMAG